MRRAFAVAISLAAVLGLFVLMMPAATSLAGGIDGKWAFVLDTEGGPREAPAEFTIDGTAVGGTWGAQPAKGTFENGDLKLDSISTAAKSAKA